MRRVSLLALFSIATPLLRADNFLVLPFFNNSKNGGLNWIGESLAETLHEALTSEGMMALDRDARVEAYRRLALRPYTLLTLASVVKVGEALDAEQVVFGTFDLRPVPAPAVNSRGSLQVTARILDLKHMKQGREIREVGALEDLAAIQEHLAWQLIQTLQPQVGASDREFQKRHPAVRLDAIENYTRGLLASNPDEAHRFFTQAARLDAHYSQPCFQLGRLLFAKKEYKSAAEWFQRVAPASAHFHEASFFLGLCRYYIADFTGAQAAFASVAREVPLNEVYNDLGAAESRANLPEALADFRKALEGDTSDPAYLFNVGYALWKQGDFEAAAASFRAVLEHDPADTQAHLLLDRCLSHTARRTGDTEISERLKTNYEESAYWQLKAVLQPHAQ